MPGRTCRQNPPGPDAVVHPLPVHDADVPAVAGLPGNLELLGVGILRSPVCGVTPDKPSGRLRPSSLTLVWAISYREARALDDSSSTA